MKTLKEIEQRLAAIKTEITKDDSDLNALETEMNGLIEERKGINQKIEQRKRLTESVVNATDASVIEEYKEERNQMKPEQFGADSKEYRSAWAKNLLGHTLSEVEERAFMHTTKNTGAVVPVELQNKIFSDMEEAHPILKDVNVLRNTGAAISFAKHVSIKSGDAKIVDEGTANEGEENEFVDVVLNGKEFSKNVTITFAQSKMAIPAFEQYLVNEISERIGAAMARDIVAQVRKDLVAANKKNAATPGKAAFTDVLGALAAIKGSASKVVVYATSSTLYNNIYGMTGPDNKLIFVDNAREGMAGTLVGKPLKAEDALAEGEILFLDPSKFMYNEVQPILIKKTEGQTTFNQVIAGIAIAEGTMTSDRGGAIVTVGEVTP